MEDMIAMGVSPETAATLVSELSLRRGGAAAASADDVRRAAHAALGAESAARRLQQWGGFAEIDRLQVRDGLAASRSQQPQPQPHGLAGDRPAGGRSGGGGSSSGQAGMHTSSPAMQGGKGGFDDRYEDGDGFGDESGKGYDDEDPLCFPPPPQPPRRMMRALGDLNGGGGGRARADHHTREGERVMVSCNGEDLVVPQAQLEKLRFQQR